MEKRLDLVVAGKSVPCIVNSPSAVDSSSMGLILAHGAGGGMDSGHLQLIARGLVTKGILCVRFSHRSPQVSARADVYKAVLHAAASEWTETSCVKAWILGGHSMGSRVACEVAGLLKDDTTVAGCVMLSYPFHPPGKPDQVRMECLTASHWPLLVVRGTRDPFAKPDIYQDVMAKLRKACTAFVQVHEVQGGDHGLQIPGCEDSLAPVLEAIVEFAHKIKGRVAPQTPANQPCKDNDPTSSMGRQTRKRSTSNAAAKETNAEGGTRKRARRKHK